MTELSQINTCAYCKTQLSELGDVEEHLNIHKTLKHKELPTNFLKTSAAFSSLPIIKDYFRPESLKAAATAATGGGTF